MKVDVSDAYLWGFAIGTFGVGDVATTEAGLSVMGVEEAHPLSARVLDVGGTEGMIAAKVVFFALAAALYRAAPEEWRTGVPLGLCLFGVGLMLHNVRIIKAAAEASA